MTPRETFDLNLASGRIRAERLGPADGPLVLCVHGLSANLRAYDGIGDALAAADHGRQIVAVDLRGRGGSEITPPGTYGLDAHAADVLAIADALGAAEFDFVGWSMGALIGMRAIANAPGRIRRLVLLDHAGEADDSIVALIRAGLARLDAVVPSPEVYLSAIRDAGAVTPWSPFWDAFYGYELTRTEDGMWTASTDRAAATEDLEQIGLVRSFAEDVWPAVTVPTLLIRCTVPVGGGLVVPERTLERFRATLPDLRVENIDRNHYTLMDDPRTSTWIADFLTA